VLLLIGMGLEFWADDLVSAANNPELVVVVSSKGVDPIGSNPHIWLDPVNAVSQAELIRDALVEVDPDGEETYREATASLIDDLRRLDQEVAERIGGWSQRSFIAFHPAWVYFARRYGLEQAAVVEETPGHEPSPAEVAEIVETARDVGARAIFAEPQLPPGIARAIAEEAGATVAVLDPLGGAAAPEDYVSLIRYNVDAMARAMK
jgi:ABC-type Zn uptake system ZnuABC Zn-binding protein ZnuA